MTPVKSFKNNSLDTIHPSSEPTLNDLNLYVTINIKMKAPLIKIVVSYYILALFWNLSINNS